MSPSEKKQKKAKKQKIEEVEEQAEEQQPEEQPQEENGAEEHAENGAEEEPEEPIKKKQKKKHVKAQEESQDDDGEDSAQVTKVVKSLSEVDDEFVEQFRSVASKIIKKYDNPADPLAAAIAILSGATKVVTKSALTQREGYTTYILTKNDEEIRGKSFAFGIIKRMLGEEEGDAAVSNLTFTKDHMVKPKDSI